MLPNLSIFWVIALVMLLTVILDRLLFRPVTRVMQERARRIEAARQVAEEASAKALAATAAFEEQTSAARAEVYRQMEDARRMALSRRTDLLAETREESAAALADAVARLQAEAEAARARLASEADELGTIAAERILGRNVS